MSTLFDILRGYKLDSALITLTVYYTPGRIYDVTQDDNCYIIDYDEGNQLTLQQQGSGVAVELLYNNGERVGPVLHYTDSDLLESLTAWDITPLYPIK